MHPRKSPLLRALFVIALAGLLAGPGATGIYAQEPNEVELERLVGEGEAEQDELEQLETDVQGIEEEEGVMGKVRLPRGEDAPQMMITQDRPITPAEYIIGPGDVMQLYIWGEFDISYKLLVDPEGRILIPTVGDFGVSGQTLASVREQVYEAAKEKYAAVEMTLNLESMRFFTVYITGAVTHEGALAIHPTKRLSDAIDLAGGFIDELRGHIGEQISGGKEVTRVRRLQGRPTARRAIILSHEDATVDTVDLTMYLSTGDLKHNPYLSMGDRIHVTYRKDTVSIFGPWYREGQQEYRPGDTIGDIVTLVNGRRADAPIEYVEVWRWREGLEEYEIIPLAGSIGSGADIPLEEFADFPLEPWDQVYCRTPHEWRYGPRVTIYGEVHYNGNYRIDPGETTLADIVRLAGGFTEDAYLELATVTSDRFKYTDPEMVRVKQLRRVTKLRPEESSYLTSKSLERRGNIVVDFVRLFEENDESQNVILNGGDEIQIPKKRPVVKLTGAFEKPGLITHVPGQGIDHYLAMAGGFARLADRGEARLIRADTGIRYEFDDDLRVQESDEIWVPVEPYRDWWDITVKTANVVSTSLTMIVVLTALSK